MIFTYATYEEGSASYTLDIISGNKYFIERLTYEFERIFHEGSATYTLDIISGNKYLLRC